jgi:hypothetical protein
MRAVRAAAVTAKIEEMRRQRMAREARGGERSSGDEGDEGDEGEGDSSEGSGSSDESGRDDDGVYEERAPNRGVLFHWLCSHGFFETSNGVPGLLRSFAWQVYCCGMVTLSAW